MTHDQFWELIATAGKQSGRETERVPELLGRLLLELPPEEIVAFDAVYDDLCCRAYRRPLWGAAYLINGGCSDDGFESFRGWLIAQGRKVFEAALESPDSLSSRMGRGGEGAELEDMVSVATRAYMEKTGKELPRRQRASPELSGRDWKE